MEPLIAKLNERIAEKVGGNRPQTADAGFQQKFDQVLNEKRLEQLDKIGLDVADKDSGMKVLPAENIKINMTDIETGAKTDFDPKARFFAIFDDMNSDMLTLDSAIEVLANPDVRLNKRQLLAYQAGIGNMTINAELFSRLAQTVSQNLNTLLQTNVG